MNEGTREWGSGWFRWFMCSCVRAYMYPCVGVRMCVCMWAISACVCCGVVVLPLTALPSTEVPWRQRMDALRVDRCRTILGPGKLRWSAARRRTLVGSYLVVDKTDPRIAPITGSMIGVTGPRAISVVKGCRRSSRVLCRGWVPPPQTRCRRCFVYPITHLNRRAGRQMDR